MKKIIILLLILPSIIFAAGNVFDKMDETAIKATGINKLTRQEQDELLKWLNGTDKKTEKASREVLKQKIRTEIVAEEKIKQEHAKEIIKKEKIKNMGFRKKDSDREEIHSSIVGEFNGWRGKNIFKLANGQIWKQAEKTTFYIPKRNNPNITIKPKSMGSWQLYVDGFGRGVKVKRIK